ncbi:phosphoenolpyruvate carboxykinase (ATP) [Hydrotalea sp.]|uniref:phosphoenolpyruvate carboxykinase (ATP) n=1 Tax=Hydrotalea sp. TaxID=2881279 RepID=UPI0026108AFE|nr:phosphoenolpyruvate carboxykinase (ATP) [Hydrotalea sp.]
MIATLNQSLLHEQLNKLGFSTNLEIHYQLSPETLIEQTLLRSEGVLNNTGALCVHTGKFTGRSPLDKFIVKDSLTEHTVDWNIFNIPFDGVKFAALKQKLIAYCNQKNRLWVRDAFACAHPDYRIKIRVINENPWSNLFTYNMFIRPSEAELQNFVPEWHIIQAPDFLTNPTTDGTRQGNFAIISFTEKTIIIGGTAYTGEIKKGIFSVLNFLFPIQHQTLSMHCSANVGKEDDVALFFGLSGTGKTTLSADATRKLIGDDEHGWDEYGIFNFEGGCYAKCIDLDEAKEPEIYHAIRPGALVENVVFYPNTNQINFSDKSITENTRVSYPLEYISNALIPSIAGIPKNIFFLTCDAYGVLPPISKLSTEQAMYQFISGYTAKVAGTEAGVTEPKATFSTCFGAPFMPLHPGKYAALLGKKIKKHQVQVWMVNTGWTGGAYGIGKRMNLQYTRAMICAALSGKLQEVEFEKHTVFGVQIPKTCPGVPVQLLHPRYTWTDRNAYDKAAHQLAILFNQNFEKYQSGVSNDIIMAAPKTTARL